MKKRLLSILLMCCMVLTLLPTTAFAEDSAEEPLVCSCETACTADNMNKECPVCGAENAIPQNCGQYIPVEDRTGENGSTERADDPNGPIELSAADQVQAMIDGLPNAEEITEDNAEEVKAQLEAIDEAKEKLSDEEIDELDMTRYAEAAAALGALAAPMLLANDSPDEQFSLTPGGRYYFDLSAVNIPGTANGGNSDGAVSLPDTSLHYVPFTYVGTIEAYKLTSATATTEEYAQQNKYPHSLFVADYAVTHTVSWDTLNTANLIFGKDYAANGELEDYWFLDGLERGDKYCLEGYLFPDTYEFYTNDTAENVLNKMLGNFDSRVDESIRGQLDSLNGYLVQLMTADGRSEEYISSHLFSLADVITVASLIEKESASAEESYTIASVIYNRLFAWGSTPAYLNIDAAVIYGLDGKTDLTQEDLQTDTAYNTYLHTGLTPGPITNPGLNSIKAALAPQNTNYYYYILDPAAGTHHFSSTLEEHEAFREAIRG